jgi:hypothetical protein
MSTIKNVERQIRKIEGFIICFLYPAGTDVRGDKTGLPQYKYKQAASSSITVEAWKKTRFRKVYPGYDVDVLDGNQHTVRGNTKLRTVRRSYEK